MSRRAWRVMLVVGLVGVIALAGAQIWRLDRERVLAADATQAFDDVAQRLSRAVLSARASERAYVATGQGYAFWKPGVDRTLLRIREDLSELKATGGAAAAGAAAGEIDAKVDPVLEALTAVTRVEQRIADHAAAGRLTHASDLVFADGLQASLSLERAVDALIEAHRTAHNTTVARARWQELGLTGGIAAAGLLVALLLAPLPKTGRGDRDQEQARERERQAQRGASGDRGRGAASTAGASAADAVADLPLRPRERDPGQREWATAATTAAARNSPRSEPRPGAAGAWAGTATATTLGLGNIGTSSMAKQAPIQSPDVSPAAPAPATPSSSSSTAESGFASAGEGGSPASPSVSGSGSASTSALEGAAALCSALARAANGADLDSLLPQLAEQLDAVGLIVWLKDEDEHALKAALSYGYPEQTLAALAAIDPDADHATARAARLGEPQIVSASGTTPGAIVVPMLTASGCVGVVSIEVPPGREHDATMGALARIFAAQLAMLTA